MGGLILSEEWMRGMRRRWRVGRREGELLWLICKMKKITFKLKKNFLKRLEYGADLF